MKNKNICWFDLETTGIDTENDRIVQIAVCITDQNLNIISGPFDTLVNPEIPISKGATETHGITDKMVANSPKFADIAGSLYATIGDCDLGGYNLKKFDVPLLMNEFNRVGINMCIIGRNIVDSYLVFSKKETRNLSNALKFYCNKEMEGAHDAKDDILATIEVARGQINHYDDISTIEDLIAVTEPENTCDLAGKIIMKNGFPVFNFGKHYGKEIKDNINYLEWMLTADMPKETKDWIEDYLFKNKQ